MQDTAHKRAPNPATEAGPPRRTRPLAAVASLRGELSAAATDPLLHIRTVIMAAVIAGAIALVASDMFQRWLATETWTVNIDGRFNAVTWFHSFVLAGAALCAFALAATEATGDRTRMRQWLFIGAAFAFLSFDKSISFHERLGQEIEQAFDLADEMGRVIWQMLYAPFLAVVVYVLLRLIRGGDHRRAIIVAIAFCGAKLVLEAMMVPAIELGITSESGVLYGLEVNFEETVQLLGFGLFFATFASLLLTAIGDAATRRIAPSS